MNNTIKRVLLSCAAILVGVAAFAQVTTSSMNGKIVDESGEPLAGAAVVAVHTPSGTQYYAVANNEGRFNIFGMRAGGPYSVEVSFLGMANVSYSDVTLKLGEAYEINAQMKSVNELDAVTVVGEKSFNASITGAGSSFSLSQIENMPSINRSVYDVVKFTPQVSVNKNGGLSFSGSNNRYNSFQIDGAVANDSFGLASSGTNGGQTGANPISIDAIEEIQVVVAPFDVRQSGFTGGAINAVTKSGTNEIKGSFYSHFYNEDLIGTTAGNAQQMLDNFSKTEREKFDEQFVQTYGFTVGAPIIKNKLFFFTSAEYYNKSIPNVYTPANDTYANRPLNKEVFYNGQSLGKVFNSAMADAILEKYQSTYAPEGFSESYTQHQPQDQSINLLARLDWNINDANKLMFRYQYADSYADQYGSGAKTYYFNNSSYKQANKTNTFVAELNSRLSEKVSNEARATAVIVRDHREPGYPGATMYIRDNVTINLGTEYSSGANSMASDTYTLTDNLSVFAGNHTFTFGTHNEFFKFNNVFLQYAYGEYTFGTVADFFNDNYNQYDYKFADPEYTGGATRWAATTYALELGLYAQDEWKPSKDFTLTYGLRVDAPMLLNKPTENPTYNASEFATRNNEYVGVVPKVQPLFSPRVGFRWYLNDSHKSLLRGGAGLFTGRVPFVWLSNAYNNTGMETKSITNKTNKTLPLTSDPYNQIIKTGILSAATTGATINTLNENFKYPQVARANLGFDQEFDGGWKFTFDALFSKTLNNVFFNNLAITTNNSVYPVSADAAAINPEAKAPYYTVYSGDYMYILALSNTNKGYTYSLSGQVKKHFQWGLDLMAYYTFGHSYSINDGTSSVALSNWKYNYSIDTNSPDELSYALFDKPHRFAAEASYTTPMYAGRFMSHFTLTYQGGSGQRFCYTMNEATTSIDFNGDGQYGNSLLYIPTKDELVQMNWADAASAAKFENFIRSDSYLSTHRGHWSERYAGIAPFEHHFDLQFAQDFYYDKKHGRKVQLAANLINASNLINRSWGLYYSASSNRNILKLEGLTKDSAGNATPTYSFYDDNSLKLNNFNSRWRCQLSLKVTF